MSQMRTVQDTFRDTEIGPIPVEWEVAPLAKVVTFPRKPRELHLPDFEVVPFVPMELIPDDGIAIADYVPKQPSEIRSGTYFERGDILLAKITPSFENGKQGIAENLPTPFGYATTEVYPLHPQSHRLDRMFLFHYLRLSHVRAEIAGRMEGTTGRQRVPKKVIETYPIPLPPLPEQRRIACVLGTIQRAIAVQDDLIAAARELKRSLMHRLFTYGPSPEPVRTKETEIGEMPAHWEIVRLRDVVEIASGGTPSRKRSEYWGGEIQWVKTGEVNYSVITSTEEHITREGLKNSSARLVPAGTLLLAMYGQGVTRGRVAILGIEAAINQACAAMFVQEGIITEFLYHFLTSSYERIRNLGHGAHQKNLSATLLRSVQITQPPILEQQAIARILTVGDHKIEVENRRKAALQELFKSMLHQLMTGQIRVRDDLPPGTPEPTGRRDGS